MTWLRLAFGLLAAISLWAYAGNTAPPERPGHLASDTLPPVGLCVRTGKDDLVVHEARVMRSSGDPLADAEAAEDVVGMTMPIPNVRKWFEWTSMEVLAGSSSRRYAVAPFDCEDLDRQARIKDGGR